MDQDADLCAGYFIDRIVRYDGMQGKRYSAVQRGNDVHAEGKRAVDI